MGDLTRMWEHGLLGDLAYPRAPDVYIIAEAGVNHNGSYDEAMHLVATAIMAGANAVKFQAYTPDLICRMDNPEYAMLKRCQLSHEQLTDLQKFCTSGGIDFICTPHDLPAAEFLETLKMPYMKIGSGQAKQVFLDQLKVSTPLLVSLGMGAGPWLKHPALHAFMHCVSSYPCPPVGANMARVGDKILGFSDHTIGSHAAIMAVARGAKFIEKHVTMNKSNPGPDHHMSAEPDEFAHYCGDIRTAVKMLGNGKHDILPCEMPTIQQLQARK